MNLIIQNIEELKKQFGYEKLTQLEKNFHYCKSDFDDAVLNRYEENLIFLDILLKISYFSENPAITRESILYSQYYWNHLLLKRTRALSLHSGDCEEWEFYLIQQLDLCGNIDCDLLQKLENYQI